MRNVWNQPRSLILCQDGDVLTGMYCIYCVFMLDIFYERKCFLRYFVSDSVILYSPYAKHFVYWRNTDNWRKKCNWYHNIKTNSTPSYNHHEYKKLFPSETFQTRIRLSTLLTALSAFESQCKFAGEEVYHYNPNEDPNYDGPAFMAPPTLKALAAHAFLIYENTCHDSVLPTTIDSNLWTGVAQLVPKVLSHPPNTYPIFYRAQLPFRLIFVYMTLREQFLGARLHMNSPCIIKQ